MGQNLLEAEETCKNGVCRRRGPVWWGEGGGGGGRCRTPSDTASLGSMSRSYAPAAKKGSSVWRALRLI